MKPLIEVGLRGLMSEEQYHALVKRLKDEGVPVETDDKDTYFFKFPQGIFKVCDEVSNEQGKLSVKIGSEDTGVLKEMEIIVGRDQVPAFLDFFSALGHTEYYLVPQKRLNFFLPDSTLSLKYTDDFKYHFELEGELLEDESLVEAERARLKGICREFGLVPMEPEEIAARVREIHKRMGYVK